VFNNLHIRQRDCDLWDGIGVPRNPRSRNHQEDRARHGRGTPWRGVVVKRIDLYRPYETTWSSSHCWARQGRSTIPGVPCLTFGNARSSHH